MAEENTGRRKDKKLKDILDMSIKLHDSEDKELKPTPALDPEKKEFLQHAIDSVLENDDEKRLVVFTHQLLQYKIDDVLSDVQLEQISEVFEELNFLLEGLDKGISFDKLGGLKHCLNLMRCNYTSIQWKAADTIANCVQNVPQNQFSIIKDKGLEVLLYVLKKSDVDIVKVKCLYALSSLVGGNNVAEKLFVDLKGVETVLKFLSDYNAKIRMKTAFLLRKIIMSDNEIVRFIENKVDIVLYLVDLLVKEIDDSHETIADILFFLLKIDGNLLREFKKILNLSNIFSDRKKELEALDSEKYQELIELYVKLLSKM